MSFPNSLSNWLEPVVLNRRIMGVFIELVLIGPIQSIPNDGQQQTVPSLSFPLVYYPLLWAYKQIESMIDGEQEGGRVISS